MDRMERSETDPVARGLARVADIWGVLVVRDASREMTRFEQFRISLGIVPNIFSRRLKALTDAGLLERRRYSERPPRDEYILTPAGTNFIQVLNAIRLWADAHFPALPEGAAPAALARACS